MTTTSPRTAGAENTPYPSFVDVGSPRDLRAARAAGTAMSQLVLRNHARRFDFVRAAVAIDVGRVVVDTAGCVELVASAARVCDRRQPVLLGLLPAGVPDRGVLHRVLRRPELALLGVDLAPGPPASAWWCELTARRIVDSLAAIRDAYGLVLTEVHLAGRGTDAATVGRVTRQALLNDCGARRLPVPDLFVDAAGNGDTRRTA